MTTFTPTHDVVTEATAAGFFPPRHNVEITQVTELTDRVMRLTFRDPFIASHAKPAQFVNLFTHDDFMLMPRPFGVSEVDGDDVSRYADWSWSIDDAEGNVVDLLNKLEQGDDLKAYDRKPIILSCGPLPMMKAVADWAAERGIPAQLSMEQRMGCGYGTCVLCTIDTVDGRLKVCSDGPVFTREQLGWGK